MIDLSKANDLRPIRDIAEEVTGKRPCLATQWRWIHLGRGGVKLESVWVGRWLTSDEAFHDFIRTQTENRLRARKVDSLDEGPSDAELQAAGLL